MNAHEEAQLIAALRLDPADVEAGSFWINTAMPDTRNVSWRATREVNISDLPAGF